MRKPFSCLLLASICVLIFALTVYGADAPAQPERYRKDFAFRDFRMNQDGLKYEVPENGAYKIMPRLKNTAIWTHFPVPSEAKAKLEWRVQAVVRGSEGSAAGVGLWTGDTGYSFYLYPDGKASLQYYEGKKSVWKSNAEIKNFGYPANLTLRRDANGSIVAEVNGLVAAVRLLAIDIKEPQIADVTSVSFSTYSPASMPKGGIAVSYERLEVEAWRTKASTDAFEALFGTQS